LKEITYLLEGGEPSVRLGWRGPIRRNGVAKPNTLIRSIIPCRFAKQEI